MSLTTHKMWGELVPFIKLEQAVDSRNPRFRIEVNRLPPDLESRALATTMPCVKCSADIHPIRARKGANLRRSTQPVHLYFAAACSMEDNIGCSRGKEARAEYGAVIAAVQKYKSEQELLP